MSTSLPKKKDLVRVLNLYGENKIIEGKYDSKLAVKCENGIFVGKEKNGILSYKGIPFALPPVGKLRWKKPAPVHKSNVVKEAYYFGKAPLQAPWFSELGSCYPNGEDCLYLNIWADKDKKEKKPVMVFIHGGAYGYGSTSDPMYDGQNFIEAHRDVILVTIAYRVSTMGFIDFSKVRGSEGYEDSCNLGLLDQVEALRWIQKNISAFGGDKNKVTVFGESAGGGSVSLLPIMECARGLFKRVIAESGSVALTYSKNECQEYTKMFLKITKCKNMEDLLKLTEDDILKANRTINNKNNFPQRDGRIIPFDCYKAYEEGKSQGVDMLMGTNKDECRYWIKETGGFPLYAAAIPLLLENQIKPFSKQDLESVEAYFNLSQGRNTWTITEFENDVIFRVPCQKQLELHAKNGGNSYHYFWTFPSSIRRSLACHAVELSSVFNNPNETIYAGSNYDQELAKEVQQMWVNFAKTGDPSTKKHKFPKYNSDNKVTMILGREIRVEKDLYLERTRLCEDYLKYYINGNYSKLSLNTPYFKKIILIAGVILVIIALIAIIIVVIVRGLNTCL